MKTGSTSLSKGIKLPLSFTKVPSFLLFKERLFHYCGESKDDLRYVVLPAHKNKYVQEQFKDFLPEELTGIPSGKKSFSYSTLSNPIEIGLEKPVQFLRHYRITMINCAGTFLPYIKKTITYFYHSPFIIYSKKGSPDYLEKLYKEEYLKAQERTHYDFLPYLEW